MKKLLLLSALAMTAPAQAQLVIDEFGGSQSNNTEIGTASAIGGVRQISAPGTGSGLLFDINVADGRFNCAGGFPIAISQPVSISCSVTWDGNNDGVPDFINGVLGTGSLGGGIDLATTASGIEVVVALASNAGVTIRALNYDGSECTLTSEPFVGATTLILPFNTTGCLDAGGQRPTDVRSIALDVGAIGIDTAGARIDRVRLIPRPSYTVGGTLTGLAPGSSVTLQNNGGDDLLLEEDGSFTFATEVFDQSAYGVTVAAQPSDPLQRCTVTNGSGPINGGPVDTVDVQCAPAFSIGGTVSGLRLPGLVLDLNGESTLLFDQDGPYSFPLGVADGGDYDVTTALVPVDHDCQIDNGTGMIAGANITNANVTCTTDILFNDGLETLSIDPIPLD